MIEPGHPYRSLRERIVTNTLYGFAVLIALIPQFFGASIPIVIVVAALVLVVAILGTIGWHRWGRNRFPLKKTSTENLPLRQSKLSPTEQQNQ